MLTQDVVAVNGDQWLGAKMHLRQGKPAARFPLHPFRLGLGSTVILAAIFHHEINSQQLCLDTSSNHSIILGMIIEGRFLDEILRTLYNELSNSTDTFNASKGEGQDLLASTVILKNPRARISSTETRGRLISALAEFCWYMNGSADLDFMRYYIREYPPEGVNGNIEEAYGPRLIGTGQFGRTINQVERVIERLKKKPDTRRAVISLLEPTDLEPAKGEAPCTVALQFIHRRDRLHMIAMMRSNDSYKGFIHDVFCFTMIQEIVARSLGIGVGEYHHFATSLHLYADDVSKIERYFDEGFQNPTFAMPKMPSGCQLANLEAFLETEKRIREGSLTLVDEIKLPVYWRDMALILLMFSDRKQKRGAEVTKANFSQISDDFYKNFFVRKPKLISNAQEDMVQEAFDLGEEDSEQN